MLGPQDFFDLKDFHHGAIFSEGEPVWTALDHLPDYLATFFQNSWPPSNITGQIDRALVIYEGEVRDDLVIKTIGSTIQVYRKEEKLEWAAVILPGAFLFNDKIIIGPGTIVEPAAFLKWPG
jgi:hypothetical protein